MDLFFIALLVFLGLLFLVAEIILLPGVTLGAVLSLVSYGGAIYLAFRDYGVGVGLIVLLIVILLSVGAAIISLRAKTWQRFSLKQKITSSSMPSPVEENVKIGDRGITISRLSPMGKVDIDGRIYEAKSQGEYVDPKQAIEVIGFENFNVIVKKTE